MDKITKLKNDVADLLISAQKTYRMLSSEYGEEDVDAQRYSSMAEAYKRVLELLESL